MATGLLAKQQRFVQEYLLDLNATQAAIRAGYSPKTADVQASRLLTNVKVREAIAEAMAKRSERTQIDQDWVLWVLKTNVEQALRAVPVRNKQGEEIGDYTYDGAVVNKAAELLGRHLRMFPERRELTGENGGPIEVVHRDMTSFSDEQLRDLVRLKDEYIEIVGDASDPE